MTVGSDACDVLLCFLGVFLTDNVCVCWRFVFRDEGIVDPKTGVGAFDAAGAVGVVAGALKQLFDSVSAGLESSSCKLRVLDELVILEFFQCICSGQRTLCGWEGDEKVV